MLGSIGDTLGKMGDTGNQYVDTFRRLQAPEADMSDSASLLNYSDWARRNGYDDEAKQYMALGYRQKAIEGEKAFRTGIAEGSEKLRGYNNSIDSLKSTIEGYQKSGVGGDQFGPADPKLENAKMALAKIEGERQVLVGEMNALGNSSDFGDGNEGTVAERQLIAERIAAEKAAVESERSFNELMLQRAELADFAQKSERIPDALLPPSHREAYNSAYLAAKNSPQNPEAAMRDVNSRFRGPGDKYLEGLGKGDPASIAAVASAEKQLREIDPDIAEWLASPENETLIKYARDETASALKSNPDYRAASAEGKTAIAADTYRSILRGYNEDLDEAIEEARQDLIEDGARDARAAKVKSEDYMRGYPKGWHPNGPEYKKEYKAAKKADGAEFDSAAFAEAWNAQYYRPNGMRSGTNSSPTSRVLTKGPY
jgi:hypothetical protein